jgi:hypothetical protein
MALTAPSVEGPEFAERVRRAEEIASTLQANGFDFDAAPDVFARQAACGIAAKEIVIVHDGRVQTTHGRLVMKGVGQTFQLNSPSSALNVTLAGRPDVFEQVNKQVGSRGLEDLEAFQGFQDIQDVRFFNTTNFYQPRDLVFWSVLYGCGLLPSGFQELARHMAAGRVVTGMLFVPGRPSRNGSETEIYVQGFTGKQFPTPVVEWIPTPLFGGMTNESLHVETLLTLDPTDLTHPVLSLVAEGSVVVDDRRYYMRRFVGTSAKQGVRGPNVGLDAPGAE